MSTRRSGIVVGLLVLGAVLALLLAPRAEPQRQSIAPNTTTTTIANPAVNATEPRPTNTATATTAQATATAIPTATAVPTPCTPVRIIVSDKVDSKIVRESIVNNVAIVPDHEVAWYPEFIPTRPELTGAPGENKPVILGGHVLRFRASPQTPAPLELLNQSQPGDQVVIECESGNVHRYTIVSNDTVAAADEHKTYSNEPTFKSRMKEILTTQSNSEILIVVTCAGDAFQIGTTVHKTHRQFVIAIPQN